MIRVLLADDQVLVRAGFRMLLESAGDIEVVGEAANGGTAVATRPEMRMTMPEFLTRLAVGTVTQIDSPGVSMRPFNSAAVRWLSTAPSPDRNTAAQSQVSRAGGPLKTA